MPFNNSKGKIFYGMHFYPGVAEYAEAGGEPYRIFLNEDTIRAMDPTFAGRPIFVEHVDDVNDNVDELRSDADGWVIESFFNAADGKHWAKFIIVSERGEKAIKQGLRLSNAYHPKTFGIGGLWNGVTYAKEVTSGEFEHLAIVRNPRYEESVIMTPEKFKAYNETKAIELKRLANSKNNKEKSKMPFNLFKRTKVENSTDFEGISITLPKSGKDITLNALVAAMDEKEVKGDSVDPEAKLMVGDTEMSVKSLIEEHQEFKNELNAMKKKNKEGEEDEKEADKSKKNKAKKNKDDDDSEEMKNEEEDLTENEEEDEDKDKKKNKKKNSFTPEEKAEAKAAADALRNARDDGDDDTPARIDFMADQVARGRSFFGSNS